MNNRDFIEEFFEERRMDFQNEEPSFGHFNRFARKLEQMHNEADDERNSKKFNLGFYGIAATVLLLICSIGIYYLNGSSNSTNSPQMVNSQAPASNVIEASAENMQQMNELEVEYLRLKFEYSQTYDSAILDQIRENLSKRAAFVEKMCNKKSLESYTFNASHDQCCGFGNDFNPHNHRDLYGEVAMGYE